MSKSRSKTFTFEVLDVDHAGVRMNKPDAAFGCFRQHVFRKAAEVITERVHRIDHDSFGRSRMRALALERDRRRARAPRFIADLAELSAVNGVSDLRAEAFDVKLLDARADFFVRSESDRDRSVFDLRILAQRVDHRHDFGDAGFVVGTEQRCAVGGDDVVADQMSSDRDSLPA